MSHDSRVAVLWTAGVTVALLAVAVLAWQFGLFDLSTGQMGGVG